MNGDDYKANWSDPVWKEMLVYQRKMMWADDTLERLVKWMGIEQGMTAVDVGCGLGYLGYTYWQYFGSNGHYIGIDTESDLIGDASQASKEWAIGGSADFHVGSAYDLPLQDSSADWAMCQTLLMHLDKPMRAIEEMFRVLKPGGLIMCNEPDNVNPSIGKHFNSLPELSLNEILLSVKIRLLMNEGRIKMGHGDAAIAPKIPHMMATIGFEHIRARQNDGIHLLEPPYDDPKQQNALDRLKKQWLDEKRSSTIEAREREHFLAAGGDIADYDRYERLDKEYREIMRKQIEDEEFYACGSGAFYSIIGRKPK